MKIYKTYIKYYDNYYYFLIPLLLNIKIIEQIKNFYFYFFSGFG